MMLTIKEAAAELLRACSIAFDLRLRLDDGGVGGSAKCVFWES